MKVVFLRAAEQDLVSIHGYIHNELANPIAAQGTIQAILKRSQTLAEYPELGASLAAVNEELREYRMLLAGNYLIVYRAADAAVSVVRVLYARSDYVRLLALREG